MDDFLVGYCHGGTVYAAFHESMLRVMLYDLERERRWRGELGKEGLYVAWSRNEVCRGFLNAPKVVEWLWMVDTDMVIPAEVPYRLIESARSVGGWVMSGWYCGYCSTAAPGELLTVWYEEAGADSPTWLRTVTVLDLEKPQRLAAVGMGCCLIHRRVLERMREEYPGNHSWFAHELGKDHGELREMGEDITFCRRAKALGYEIWGDSRITCGHVKRRVENVDRFWEAEERRGRLEEKNR